MIINYYDVILRRDFEILEVKYNVSLIWVYNFIFLERFSYFKKIILLLVCVLGSI